MDNSFSSFDLKRWVRKQSPATKKLMASLLMLPLFAFCANLAYISLSRVTKKKEDLAYVKGEILDSRLIKHLHSRRKMSIPKGIFQDEVVKEVLVLTIDGTTDEFGFMDEDYKKLIGVRMLGRVAEIYYDKEGSRIEENVTLHVFDMTIGNYHVFDFDKKKKEEWPGAILLTAICVGLLVVLRFIFRDIDKRQGVGSK